jgi:mRNA interferase MazF
MLNSGDVVDVQLGPPGGREAGFSHPAVVVTSRRLLERTPSVVHVVPLTTTIRRFGAEISIEPDEVNGLDSLSAAQCQHIRAVSNARIGRVRGNVGPIALSQIREVIALILDLPL